MKQEPIKDKDAKADEWMPRMSGTMHGWKPQWRHKGVIGKALNKKLIVTEGGDDWTLVEYTTIRGGCSIRVNGHDVPVGVPFPRHQPGVLETIWLCGEAQAWALAWAFAAHCEAIGAEVEVRAHPQEIVYEIKAREVPPKVAA